jgi:MFS family permease
VKGLKVVVVGSPAFVEKRKCTSSRLEDRSTLTTYPILPFEGSSLILFQFAQSSGLHAISIETMKLTGKALQTAQLLLVVAPAFVLFGYNQSGVGGLLSLRDWNDHFPEINTVDAEGAEKSYRSTIQGAVVATFTIGALFGALSCSWIGDILGRRKLVFFAAVLTLIGEILQCTSFQVAQFIVGRLILGAGVGALSATVPVWQSECSSTANRGKHVVLDGCFISLGYLLEAWINLGFFEIKDNDPLQWRIPLAIPCVISMMLMATTFYFPESPRWLVRKGRTDEARASLSAFKQLELNDPEVSAELAGIEFALEENGRGAAKFTDIFTMGPDKLFYRFSLCIFLQFLQQMCGSNLISTYSTVSFLATKIRPIESSPVPDHLPTRPRHGR